MSKPRFRLFRPSLLPLECRDLPSTLIYSNSNRRDLVYDNTRDQLYITTTAGTIERYDAVANKMLAAISIPGSPSLNGADITPDGSVLIVADANPGPTQGFVHRVDLPGGTNTNLTYNLQSLESGSYDIVAVSNTQALMTTSFAGSGWTPLRNINLTTNQLTTRSDLSSVRQDSLMSRAADRSRVLLGESNISSGPIHAYATVTDSFGPEFDTDQFLGTVQSAVSRDGSLLALESGSLVSIFTSTYAPVENLIGIDGGMIFDPVRDRIYGINAATDELIAYDSKTWREMFRMPVGENVSASGNFATGVMSVNPIGTVVYLGTPAGVRRFDLPADSGVASKLSLAGFPAYIPGSTAATFTVTAYDPAGNVDTDFTGTVTITSSAGSASLPAAYNFSVADGGRKTFTAAIHSLGTFSLTANSTGLTAGSQTGIAVHNTNPVSKIPVSDYRGMVYDTGRDLLYFSTPRGTIERYSPTTRTLLAPWTVGGSLLGIDIAPDGSAVYVADSAAGATGGFVRKVNPDTGELTRLGFVRDFGEAGAFDLAIYNNGKALFTTQYKGSGWVPLHQIDLATDAISNLPDVRQNSLLSRGFDRSLGLITESNISSGPIHTYKAATNAVSAAVNTSTFLDSRPHSVNRDGTLIALETSTGIGILNSSLGSVINLTGPDGGMVFDPLQDRLYAGRSNGTITVYNTGNWSVITTYPVADTVPASTTFNSETMAVSDDGRWLFLDVTGGVHVRRLVLNTTAMLDAAPAGPITFGQSVTLTAIIAGGKASERAGQMVTFKNGAATLGTAPLNTAGVATLNLTPSAGTYSITVMYAGDANYNTSTSPAVPFVVTPPVGIGSIAIGDGSTFSVVRSVTVAFSGLVTVNAGAFTVEKLDGAGGFATVSVATQTVDSKTVAVLSFSGGLTEFASLKDGRYRLTINGAALLDGNGAAIDADGNGQSGGTRTQNFHRLFGDADGNFTVDGGDLGGFGAAFGSSGVSPFDFNNDLTVDALDFGEFGNRFGVTL